ncbi:MAG: hypothetical protein GXO92_08085 [FCB group bacterium]|nr:hypothetical protein [FCB group bacterium]
MIENHLTDWLLQGDPWVRYRTRIDLLGQSPDHPQVQQDYRETCEHPLVKGLLRDLSDWPDKILNNHKNSGHPLHKLVFLADLGLKPDVADLRAIIARIMQHQSAEGPFQVKMNIKPAYGGSGEDTLAWALCDAPLVLYALMKFGFGDHEQVRAGFEHVKSLVRENGWPCAAARELGSFRGPGRKADPCPYATLLMVKAIALTDDRDAARVGIETLLTLWEQSMERHPYMFYMGTDFRKLKAPLIWYDIVHLADVLSRCPDAVRDKRFIRIAELVFSKADEDGRYTPESVWRPWKDWDFGRKKAPSRWLTLIIKRIEQRIQ